MFRKQLGVTLLIASALALAGCGGSSNSNSPPQLIGDWTANLLACSGCLPTWSFNLTLSRSYRYGAGDYHIGHWNTECDLGRFAERALGRFPDGLQFSTSRRYRLCELTGHADKQHRHWNLDSDRERV